MSKGLLKASIGVTIVMVIGNLLSFIKEATIANFFGVSSDVDAYSIAIQIPVLLFSFISVAVQSVVIPIYSDILYNKGGKNASLYIDNLITLLLLITSVIVIIGELLASGFIYLFAPGFDPTIHNLSTELLRVTFPTIIFSIICQVLVAILNVHKEYVINSFAIYFTNVLIIVAIVFLHSKFGILSACIGQLLGDAARCLFVVFLARKFYHFNFNFNFKNYYVNKTLKMSIPVLWSISVAEVNAIVNRMVGSFLFVGSISALSYAGKINSVLMQLFVSAIATIVYPLYAESTAKNDLKQLNSRVNSTLSVYSLFVIPLMFGIFTFKKEVVEIAFGRGAFDQDAIALTESLLGFYCLGMLFMALRSTLTNVFYSMKNTKIPAINATIGAVLNIILNITLPYFMGVQGLALASSITATFITISLIVMMNKKFKEFTMKVFWDNLRGIIGASLIMFVGIILFEYFINIDSSLLILLVGTILGCLVYFICLLLFKVPVALQLMQMVKLKR